MSDDAKQTMKELTTTLWALPLGDYLVSGDFSRFCRQNDLYDAWREYLRFSQDRPDLYGSSVLKNAFTLFLYHIYNTRKEIFPSLFTRMMAEFSRTISCSLPVDDLKRSLLLLGYPEIETDHALFSLRVRQEITPPREECCAGEKKDLQQ